MTRRISSWWLVALYVFCLAFNVSASDMLIRYSVNALPPYPQVKALTVGLQHDTRILSYKAETGFIADQRSEGAKWCGLLQAGIGVEPTWGPFYVHFFQSIGAVTSEDQYLSGYFQFFEDVGLGFKGKTGSAIGFGYKHISNAGLSIPNKGKDLLNIAVRIPF